MSITFTDPKFDHLEIQEGYRADGNGKVITGTNVGIQIVDDVNYDPVSEGAYYPTAWAVYDDGTKVYVNTETFWWSEDQIRAYVNSIRGSFVFGRGIGNDIAIKTTWRDGEAQEEFTVNVTTPINKNLLQLGIKNTSSIHGWGCDQNDSVYNKDSTFKVGDNNKHLMACGKFHYDANGTEVWEDVNNNVAWFSSDRNVAFVRTINGKLHLVAEGNAIISIQLAGEQADMNVTVEAKP